MFTNWLDKYIILKVLRGGGGVKATFGKCPKGSIFFLGGFSKATLVFIGTNKWKDKISKFSKDHLKT
jgi:hypothetical protein